MPDLQLYIEPIIARCYICSKSVAKAPLQIVVVHLPSIPSALCRLSKSNPRARRSNRKTGKMACKAGDFRVKIIQRSHRPFANSNQHPVAGRLDDAAGMPADLRVDELAAMRLEALVRPLLVRPHQTRVARRIGGEVAARRRVAVIPPAFRPCAVRRNKWLRIGHGYSAPRNMPWPASEQCSNNGRQGSISALRRVQWRSVRSPL